MSNSASTPTTSRLKEKGLSLFHVFVVGLGLTMVGLRGLLMYQGQIQPMTWVDKVIGVVLITMAGGGILYHVSRYFTQGHKVTNLIHVVFIFPLLLFTGALLVMQNPVHPVLYVLLMAFGLAAVAYHGSKLYPY